MAEAPYQQPFASYPGTNPSKSTNNKLAIQTDLTPRMAMARCYQVWPISPYHQYCYYYNTPVQQLVDSNANIHVSASNTNLSWSNHLTTYSHMPQDNMQNRVMSPHPNPAALQRISPVTMHQHHGNVGSPHTIVSSSSITRVTTSSLPPGVSNISPTPIAKENELISQQSQPSLAEWLHPLVEAATQQKESQMVSIAQTSNWNYPTQSYPSYPHIPTNICSSTNNNGQTVLKVERALQEMEKNIGEDDNDENIMTNGVMQLDSDQTETIDNGNHNIEVKSIELVYKCEDCGYELKDSRQLDLHRIVHLTKMENSVSNHETQSYVNTMQNNGHIQNKIIGDVIRTAIEEQHHKPQQIHIKTDPSPSNSTACMEDMKVSPNNDNRPFRCETCNKGFTHKSNLVCHKRTHSGEKPFRCDLCDFSCAQKGYLTVHRRMHTGERPFKCDNCGAAFSEKSHLTRHRRTHTGEKPYKCDICVSSFTQKSSLKTHMRTHTGEKAYVCATCGVHFPNKMKLRIHTMTHGEGAVKQEDANFVCDMCKLGFSGRGNLQRHVTSIHQKDSNYAAESHIIDPVSPESNSPTSGHSVQPILLATLSPKIHEN